MKRLLILLALAGPLHAAIAQHDAFPFGEPKAGASLFEAKCAGCHVRMFGNVPKAFLRENRKVKDAPTILAWVQRCNNANQLKLGREDEEHLAAYLNDAFYKFK
jgi:mono/diheme cytochrome c family protein